MPNNHHDVDLTQLDVIIRKNGDHFVAAMPQFGLFAEADTVQSALDTLEAKKKNLQADLAAFSNLKSHIASAAIESRPIRWNEITQFTIKSLIVLAIVAAAVSFVNYQAQQSINSALYKVQNIAQANLDQFTIDSGRTFWTRVERELDRAASSEIPKDKKQKLLADIRKIADNWRPFLTEAARILPPNTPADSNSLVAPTK